jgi:hypothetical protein
VNYRVLPGDLTQYSLKELQTGLAEMVLKPTALPPQADGFSWAPNVELPPRIVSRGPEDIIEESDEEEGMTRIPRHYRLCQRSIRSCQ